jgi:hypothetical protein
VRVERSTEGAAQLRRSVLGIQWTGEAGRLEGADSDSVLSRVGRAYGDHPVADVAREEATCTTY